MSQIFGEFVASLNGRKVRYLVIGGWATGFHGYPRFTKDMDVLIDRTDRNAVAAKHAIYDFFEGRLPGAIDPQADLLDPERVLQLGVPPNRIDVLNRVPGIDDFAAAWKRRRAGKVGRATASFASLQDLLASKRAAGLGGRRRFGETLSDGDRPARSAEEGAAAPPKIAAALPPSVG